MADWLISVAMVVLQSLLLLVLYFATRVVDSFRKNRLLVKSLVCKQRNSQEESVSSPLLGGPQEQNVEIGEKFDRLRWLARKFYQQRLAALPLKREETIYWGYQACCDHKFICRFLRLKPGANSNVPDMQLTLSSGGDEHCPSIECWSWNDEFHLLLKISAIVFDPGGEPIISFNSAEKCRACPLWSRGELSLYIGLFTGFLEDKLGVRPTFLPVAIGQSLVDCNRELLPRVPTVAASGLAVTDNHCLPRLPREAK